VSLTTTAARTIIPSGSNKSFMAVLPELDRMSSGNYGRFKGQGRITNCARGQRTCYDRRQWEVGPHLELACAHGPRNAALEQRNAKTGIQRPI